MGVRINPHVLDMRPYVPGKPADELQRELGLDRVVKLASNENPFGPSPRAIEAIHAYADRMHIYPDGAAYGLKSAVARKFGISAQHILVGNGSDELIHLLGHLVLQSPEDEVIVGVPGFVRYHAVADLAPCRLTKVPLGTGYRHDLTAIARAASEKTKLVYLDNPNNPTGTVFGRSDFDRLLADLPTSTMVVHDEAYYEFARHLPDYPIAGEMVAEHQNVVVLRTMSKAYGLAGLRVGYGFADAAIVDAVDRIREPFNVNAMAMVAGAAALEDDAHVERTLHNNARGMDRLRKLFLEDGCEPCESYANFLFVNIGRPARPLFEELLKRGVIIRPGDLLGDPHCLRISIGTEEDMAFFEEAYREVAMSAGVTQ